MTLLKFNSFNEDTTWEMCDQKILNKDFLTVNNNKNEKVNDVSSSDVDSAAFLFDQSFRAFGFEDNSDLVSCTSRRTSSTESTSESSLEHVHVREYSVCFGEDAAELSEQFERLAEFAEASEGNDDDNEETDPLQRQPVMKAQKMSSSLRKMASTWFGKKRKLSIEELQKKYNADSNGVVEFKEGRFFFMEDKATGEIMTVKI